MTLPNLVSYVRDYAAVPSAPYVAAPSALDFAPPYDCKGMLVTLDLTAFVTAASVSVAVLGVDSTSGKTWPIGSTVPLVADGTVTLSIHPSNPTAVVASGVQTQQGQIPPRVRVQVTQGNANSSTYSVGINFT